ncbi:MAG: phosphatidylserine decarboxylase [Candidatus Omnitrophota bacterium]
MSYWLLVFPNVLFIFLIFLFLYNKLKLPKSCFYREAIIAVFVSSIIDIAIVMHGSNPTVIFFLNIFALFISIIGVILLRFYRDPERQFHGDKNIIVSPADGRVIYIRKVEKGIIPTSIKGKANIRLDEIAATSILDTDCWLIGISMSILDVHVNRAPTEGEIVLIKHCAGKFMSLKLPDSCSQNERNIIVIKNGNRLIGVIQIASRMVRRIKTCVEEKQLVRRSDKIGKIVFGSQVDIILPTEARLLIREGYPVYAGLTPIATMSPTY